MLQLLQLCRFTLKGSCSAVVLYCPMMQAFCLSDTPGLVQVSLQTNRPIPGCSSTTHPLLPSPFGCVMCSSLWMRHPCNNQHLAVPVVETNRPETWLDV